MFFVFFSLVQAQKTFYICNKFCHQLFPSDSFIVTNSFIDFRNYLLPKIKNDTEIELCFYSKQEGFKFEINSTFFKDLKVIMKTVFDSQPFNLIIKENSRPFYKTIKITNEETILPLYHTLPKTSSDSNISLNLLLQDQTPDPSITPIPGTDLNFIDKNYANEEISDILLINHDSQISQISGCTFTNIIIPNSNNYIFQIEKEILFFSNTFSYDSFETTFSMPIQMNSNVKLTISDCKFINCMHKSNQEGNVLNSNENFIVDVTFDSSDFLNCGNDANLPILGIYNKKSKLNLRHCKFSFDDEITSSQILRSSTTNVQIDDCEFSKCGTIVIETMSTNQEEEEVFEFTNNIVSFNYQSLISANNLKRKPIINGNVIQNCDMNPSTYLISIYHESNEIELINNSFSNNRISSGEQYGGSISLLFHNIKNEITDLIYTNCQFANNKNDHSESPFNCGGAIQYGYSSSIASTNIVFNECTFTENKCLNGKGGALAVSTNQNLTINSCIFENNFASKGSVIYFLGQINDENINNEYKVESISIIQSQFINNVGDGEVSEILIEEDFIKVKNLLISSCNFSNSGNAFNQILIQSTCDNIVFEYNEIEITSGGFKLTFREDLKLQTSKFKNCMFEGESSIQLTGNLESSILITDCDFTDCKATKYSVFISNGDVVINDCNFNFKDTINSCSGLNIDSPKSVNIVGCQFVNNKNSNEGETGCLYIHKQIGSVSSLTISDVVFDSCLGLTYNTINVDCNCDSLKMIYNLTISNIENEEGNVFIFGFKTNQDLSFESCTFSNCSSNNDNGGGIGSHLISPKKISFNECSFIDNYCLNNGGSFDIGSDSINIEFQTCNFTNNKSEKFGGALSLVIFADTLIDKCLILNSTFKNNEAANGGALLIETTNSWIIDNCTFENNIATEKGGAIFVNTKLRGGFKGNSIITRSKFVSNSVISNIDGKKYGTMIYLSDSEDENDEDSITFEGPNSMNNVGEQGYMILNEYKNLIVNNIYFSYEGTVVQEFSVLYIKNGSATFNNCIFNGVGFTSNYQNFGNAIRMDYRSTIIINSCEFINCVGNQPSSTTGFVIYASGKHGHILEVMHSNFEFTSLSSTTAICMERYATFTIDSCNFTNCVSNRNDDYQATIIYKQYFLPFEESIELVMRKFCKVKLINCVFDRCKPNNNKETSTCAFFCLLGQLPILSNCTIKNSMGYYLFSVGSRECINPITLDNFNFINNQMSCKYGGTGIELHRFQSITFTNFKFINNKQTSTAFGGGAYASNFSSNGGIILDRCFFENNSVPNDNYGGAIYILAPDFEVTVSDCTFSETRSINANGISKFGGSIYIGENNAGVIIEKCKFINSSSKGDGNAICIKEGGSLITITDCIFENCHHNGHYSVIWNFGLNTLKFINNTITFTNDRRTSRGLIIYYPSDITIVNSTFYNCHYPEHGYGFAYNPGRINNKPFEEKIVIENTTFDSNFSIELDYTRVRKCIIYIYTKQQFIFKKVTIQNIDHSNMENIFIIIFESPKSAFIEEQKIEECSFNNCSTSFTQNNAGGIGIACESFNHLIFESCIFSKLQTNDYGGAISYYETTNKNFTVDFMNCIFDGNFAKGSKGGAIYINNSIEVNIENCTFFNNSVSSENKFGNAISVDQCENIFITNTKFIDCGQYGQGSVIDFSGTRISIDNNIIEYSKENNGSRGIEILSYSEIEMTNNIFKRCHCEGQGGGIHLIINIKDNNESSIVFENLVFESCFAKSGSGIQINEETHNNEIEIKNCTFIENKSNWHGGSFLIENVNKININNCLFEGNTANEKSTKSTSSKIFSIKDEGRGGAIFITSSYDTEKSNETEILIEKCTFINNKGYDGNGIYIEGYGYGSEFIIRENNFTNNFRSEKDENDPFFIYRAVITSEVFNLYEGKILTENKINNFDDDQTTKLMYVNHEGIPILPTKTFEFSQSNFFSDSNQFSPSNLPTMSPTQTTVYVHTKRVIYSNSFSLTYVLQKSISFSISFFLSKTFSMSYNEEENTYVILSSETNYYRYFPYLIRYLSPSYVPTFISINKIRKKGISQEQLIGLTCGSASVFFLVLGIMILVIRRRSENQQIIDEFEDISYSYSFDETNNDKDVEKTQNSVSFCADNYS